MDIGSSGQRQNWPNLKDQVQKMEQLNNCPFAGRGLEIGERLSAMLGAFAHFGPCRVPRAGKLR